mmetsp:Transcript_3053/g.8776  ORF Transcript_3053/g.8776 Transcript_3053/m.8776 type:complete len:434 (-) Transcript_3053:118-1419(-)
MPLSLSPDAHQEYLRALLRAPIVTILYLALWGIAVFFIKTTLHIDLFGTVLARPSPPLVNGRLPGSSLSLPPAPSPRTILLSALALLGTLLWSFLVWCGLLHGSVEGAIFAFYVAIPFILVVLPVVGFGRGNIFPYIRTLRRVLWPSAEENVPFVEVFVADAMTSLSKVFADTGLVLAVLVSRAVAFDVNNTQFLSKPTAQLVSTVVSGCLPPFLACMPYIIRVRQLVVLRLWSEDGDERWQHAMNVIKYLFNFPTIWLAAWLATLPEAPAPPMAAYHEAGSWATMDGGPGDVLVHGEALRLSIMRAVLEEAVVFCSLSSLFLSFIWDVRMDWGLAQTATVRQCCLRDTLLFRSQWIYYSGICGNLILRLANTYIGLTGHVPAFLSRIDAAFVMEVLEILRRTLWCVFRIEWECIKRATKGEGRQFEKLMLAA